MKLRLVAVGRLAERHWREAATEYEKRLAPYVSLEVVEVSDSSIGRDASVALRREGEAVLRAIQDRSHVVAMDVEGKPQSSEGLAEWLRGHSDSGKSSLTLVVGGSAGLDAAVLERANERLSLSAMTLPHQLCRIILLEQLYRACKILRGEPYHR